MSQLECSNALDGVLVSAAREGDAARSRPGRGLAEQTRRAPWGQGTRVSVARPPPSPRILQRAPHISPAGCGLLPLKREPRSLASPRETPVGETCAVQSSPHPSNKLSVHL